MFYMTDDPLADFARYDEEQEKRIAKLPRCSQCDEHIQDEYAYYINDEWICQKCMNEYLREVEEDL